MKRVLELSDLKGVAALRYVSLQLLNSNTTEQPAKYGHVALRSHAFGCYMNGQIAHRDDLPILKAEYM